MIILPGVDGGLLAATFIPAAGLFWMVWHILIGWRLYRLGRVQGPAAVLTGAGRY